MGLGVNGFLQKEIIDGVIKRYENEVPRVTVGEDSITVAIKPEGTIKFKVQYETTNLGTAFKLVEFNYNPTKDVSAWVKNWYFKAYIDGNLEDVSAFPDEQAKQVFDQYVKPLFDIVQTEKKAIENNK